jgi:UDP-glucose 4-epimerase
MPLPLATSRKGGQAIAVVLGMALLVGILSTFGGEAVAPDPAVNRNGVPTKAAAKGFAPLSSPAGYPAPRELYNDPPKRKPSGGRKAMNVIITGGAGFIGSQLGYALWSSGHAVTLIDDMRFGYEDNLVVNGERFGRFVLADVLDPRTWPYFTGADVIFHFAALSALPVCQSHPRDAININVGGVANVLEGARLHDVRRVVFASTSATYERNEEPLLTEELPVAPTLLYSLSKVQGEQLMNAYRDVYGLETVVLRFFNVYGPHQDFRRRSPPFTSYVARELAHGRPPILHGDGTQARDYVHLRDLMHLADIVMDHPKANGEIFNVASGKAYSVNEMYRIMAVASNATNVKPLFKEPAHFWTAYPQLFAGTRPIRKVILEKEVMKTTVGSYAKAERLLGWKPKVTMEEGLAELVAYVRDAVRDGKDKDAVETAWKA